MATMVALPLLAMSLLLPAQAEAASPRVTTESAEYCAVLSERAEALRQPSPVSLALAEEGRRLCATGHVRTGIAKLRRAIRAAQADTRQSS